MSGGHFDYNQHRIFDIAESVESLILDNAKTYRLSDKTIAEFRVGLKHLRLAHAYVQRIDWLVSGDDGEESFHNRLGKDLELITTTDK